eukprot:Skav205030  [mRNA]  locus=scaffold2669:46438:50133:- [translate_table: standard]
MASSCLSCVCALWCATYPRNLGASRGLAAQESLCSLPIGGSSRAPLTIGEPHESLLPCSPSRMDVRGHRPLRVVLRHASDAGNSSGFKRRTSVASPARNVRLAVPTPRETSTARPSIAELQTVVRGPKERARGQRVTISVVPR